MSYIDGYIVPVPNAKRAAYLKMAREMAVIWKEHGALCVTECWGDDVPPGKMTSFPMAVKLEPDETVVFSWVTWPSRAVRDAGNAKVMADPRMHPDGGLPFDGKRIIFGGFEVVLEA